MKREFLQSFKVGDQPLPKEMVDAIMEENGRDIEAAKKPFGDYGHVKEQLATAQRALEGFKDVDVAQLQGKITQLQDQLKDKDREWQDKLEAMAFDGRLKDAITAAKGKDHRAVAALLDLDALKSSKNQDADIKAALESMKKEKGYLFDDEPTPPPYAGGTGRNDPTPPTQPASLSGALRERYNEMKG